MNVRQLIKLLEKLDPKAIVVVSSDEEGNSYSELSDAIGTGNWDEDERSVFDDSWNASDCCMDEDEYEEMRKLPKAIVIGP